MDRFAKIVCTLGPSSNTRSMIQSLISAGLNVARLNFSHGTHEDHARLIDLIREIADEMGVAITILQDLQGPKLRIGKLPEGKIELKAGDQVTLSSSESLVVDEEDIFIPFEIPDLHKALKPTNHILLDDGQIEMEVQSVNGERIEAVVTLGGTLKSNKGVNLPGANLTIPSFTEKDRDDLKFGLEKGVDMVAISFVKEAQDIIIVRNAIKEFAPNSWAERTPIIAKLERPEALNDLDEIMKVADGVMVARGDLGVEMSPAAVPIAQKEIIASANSHAKLVITATQMLDSMINNPRPTRAEATDVANAVFDGTDAVMLSGETAAGRYPLESVTMMSSIIETAEKHLSKWGNVSFKTEMAEQSDPVSITRAARELANDRNVAAIVVFTQSGRTARLMSKTRPDVPILAFTPELCTYQQMSLYWGVTPLLVPYADSLEMMIKHVETAIATTTRLKKGQQVILISGFPVGAFRQPNLALLHTIGDI
ncbi:MAG: Pyruvate kinase [Anaerolinea thermophila]|uniref:Pyruvate kinase n=1 Tax=Anaerolinea thermophila TaxID=167964 RepID=A0A101FWX2_9CHLR|nr:MAG: Pyruvate kinase [Anaerolinea thermophila]